MQVTCAEIIIVSVVAILFVALFRMRKLARFKFEFKSLPLTVTFEASAGSKPDELLPGEDEPENVTPVPKAKRRGHSAT